MKKTLLLLVACLLCVAGASAASLSIDPVVYRGDPLVITGNAGVGGYLYFTGENLPEETDPAEKHPQPGNMSVSGQFTHKMDFPYDPGQYIFSLHATENNETITITKTIDLKNPHVVIGLPATDIVPGEKSVLYLSSPVSMPTRIGIFHVPSNQLIDTKVIDVSPEPIPFQFTPQMTGLYEIVTIHPTSSRTLSITEIPATRGELISNSFPVSEFERRSNIRSSDDMIRFDTFTVHPTVAPTPTPTPIPTPTPTLIPTPTPEPTQEPVEKTGDLKEPEPTVEPTQEPEIRATPDPQQDAIMDELEAIKKEQERIRIAQEEQKGLLDAILDFLYGIFGIRR